jgi:hypothetical protein
MSAPIRIHQHHPLPQLILLRHLVQHRRFISLRRPVQHRQFILLCRLIQHRQFILLHHLVQDCQFQRLPQRPRPATLQRQLGPLLVGLSQRLSFSLQLFSGTAIGDGIVEPLQQTTSLPFTPSQLSENRLPRSLRFLWGKVKTTMCYHLHLR